MIDEQWPRLHGCVESLTDAQIWWRPDEASHSIGIASLTDAELLASMTIQGYDTTGLEAIYPVVDHFGMHYGQILYITKQLQGADLGFYRELDPTGRRA